MYTANVSGTGFYVPETVVTNADLTRIYDTTEEWIVERSGIRERRYIHREMGPADLAAPAVRMALDAAGLTTADLDLVIFATITPECWFPGSGCFLQVLLDLPNIPMLDIRMQCSGFIYGLSIAHQFIRTGMYRHVAVIGAEVQSTSIDPGPDGRTIGVLFGDGAGAAILSRGEEGATRGVRSTHLHAEGKYAKELWVPEPTTIRKPRVAPDMKGLFPYMNGREVFRHAVTRMGESIHEALDANGWSMDDIKLVVPHQANMRITTAIADYFKLPHDRFYSNIHRYGNTTSASIPIALAEAVREGRLESGDKLLLVAFGSGFAWGAAAIEW